MAAPLIAVVGPTGSGKSALALRLARERGGEIVSCDSLQIYRGLDVGTAKPTPEERRLVPHHLVDVVSPDEAFSAAEYAVRARAAVSRIAARGRLPLVVGGSGLYLRALLLGLFAGPARDEELRRRIERLADRYGDGRLHRLLASRDPETARRLPPRDRVRVVRALEVLFITGRPISAHQREGAEPLEGFRVYQVGLALGREELRRRVVARTRGMMEAGLVEEVRGLLDRGYSAELRPLRSIGYRQAVAVVRGRMTPSEAEGEIVTETMRFAKRQMTWFRHQASVAWFGSAEAAHGAVRAWLSADPEQARLLDPGPGTDKI